MRKEHVYLAIILVMAVALLTGCAMLEDTGISYISTDTDVSDLSDETIDNIVDNVVDSMTLNDKVGQMFIADIPSLETSEKSVTGKKLTKKMRRALRDYPVGGVILFSREMRDKKQLRRFLDNLQNRSAAGLFTVVEEEGGDSVNAARVEALSMSRYPAFSEMGKENSPSRTGKMARTTGKELSALGFNVDLAPTSDVAPAGTPSDDQHNGMDGKTFGSDPELVSAQVSSYVKGLKKSGVLSVLKHFPGQGGASSDPRDSAPDLSEGITDLRNRDYLPFQAGIRAGADFVMISAESVSSITGDDTPACMSSLVVRDNLKKELGYTGIVMTDMMNMDSVTTRYDSAQAAVNSVKAGCDVILMPEDLYTAYQGIVDAVRQGDIKESRINRSVRKIIKKKIRMGLLKFDSDLVQDASLRNYDNYQNMK